MVIRRGDVFIVNPGSVKGREMRKLRPAVVLSPDELNEHLSTVTIAPMTTGGHPHPFRVRCQFQGKRGHVVLDQIRTVDVARLRTRLGRLSQRAVSDSLSVLQEMFAD